VAETYQLQVLCIPLRLWPQCLTEIEPADLHEYPSLGAFFYRSLAPGSRCIADAALVSPADGAVQGAHVEQVKWITYSLDALLGVDSDRRKPTNKMTTVPFTTREMAIIDDREFANVNGIEYSLSLAHRHLRARDSRLSRLRGRRGGNDGPASVWAPVPHKYGVRIYASVVESDKSVQDTVADHASVAQQLGPRRALAGRTGSSRRGSVRVKPGNALFFSVIYLAPGDYHRFHRRHGWLRSGGVFKVGFFLFLLARR
jgi:phosphatidylserine decarboxylase